MIFRYSREKMRKIWSDSHKISLWLRVELAFVTARENAGEILKTDADFIRKHAKYDENRMYEIEQKTRHDFLAFVDCVLENLAIAARHEKNPPNFSAFHYGMTSSDCLDTAQSLQIADSLKEILHGVTNLMQILKTLAHAHKNTPMIGRSHGVHGEVITFGLKIAGFYDEIRSVRDLLIFVKNEVAVMKISGAMGNFTHISPHIEEKTAQILNLRPARFGTQVISRQNHAKIISALGILAAACEKIALEIRHLQRSEVYEVEEFFGDGQKGSSAMPHKKNPILSENICGLCRVLRSFVAPSLENVALWHERDMSHSSVERFVLPDAFITADFMLHRLGQILKNLKIHEKNMKKNIFISGGLVFSQRVLLALTDFWPREKAYKIVQNHALKIWSQLQNDEKIPNDAFFKALAADPEILEILGEEKLKKCFEIQHFLRHNDEIFARIFGDV